MFWISKLGVIYLQDAEEFSSFPALNNLQEILGSGTQYPSLFLASVVENCVVVPLAQQGCRGWLI